MAVNLHPNFTDFVILLSVVNVNVNNFRQRFVQKVKRKYAKR